MEKSVNFPSESLYTGYSDKAAASDHFDPYHRWDHAAMGLEKFEDYELSLNKIRTQYGMKYYFALDNGKKHYCGPNADTAPAAICLACIEAKKEE